MTFRHLLFNHITNSPYRPQNEKPPREEKKLRYADNKPARLDNWGAGLQSTE